MHSSECDDARVERERVHERVDNVAPEQQGDVARRSERLPDRGGSAHDRWYHDATQARDAEDASHDQGADGGDDQHDRHDAVDGDVAGVDRRRREQDREREQHQLRRNVADVGEQPTGGDRRCHVDALEL
jgi:hypothetical protein